MLKTKFSKSEAITFTKSVDGKYGVGDSGIIDEILANNHYRIKSSGEIINDVPESDIEAVHQSASKQVDAILRDREKDKEFKDSDIRVSGSRKEMMAFKGLIKFSDLNDIEKDAVIARKLVNKNKVYPEVNIPEEIEKGTSGGALYLKVKLRESCGAMPPDTAEARAIYVGYIQYIVDVMSMVKTIEEFDNKTNFLADFGLSRMLVIANPDLEEEVLKQQTEFGEHALKSNEYKINEEQTSKKLTERYGMFWESEYRSGEIKDKYDLQLVDEYKYWKKLGQQISQFSYGKLLPIEISFAERFAKFNPKSEGLSAKYMSQDVIENIFGVTFRNFLTGISDSVVKKYKEAFLYSALTQTEYNDAYEKYIKPAEQKIKNYSDWITFLSDPSKPYKEKVDYALNTAKMGSWWMKGYDTFKSKATFKDLVERGKDPNRILEFIKIMVEREGSGYRRELENSKAELERLQTKYKVRDNDYSWATKTPDKTKKIERKSELTINSGVPLSFIKRIGGVAVFDTDLNTGDKVLSFYKNILGMTGVTYGQTMPDNERGAHAKHFSGAMLDLAELLNFDVKDFVGLDNLKIKFGASGSGRAMAHYEPDTHAINLTRKKGDGTVVHELAHYLDKAIENKFPHKRESVARHAPYATYFSSDNVSNVEIYKAIKGLMHFIKLGVEINQLGGLKPIHDSRFVTLDSKMIFPYFSQELNDALYPLLEDFLKEVIQKEITIELKKSNTYTLKYQKPTFEEALAENKEKYPHYFYYPEFVANKNVKTHLEALLNTFKIDKYDFVFVNNPRRSRYQSQNTSTAYFISSNAMSSDYWTYDWELFARAFETYISQKQMRLGRENNYLVSGAYFDRPEGVYPVGIERDILYILFENLFSVIKKELGIKDFVPFREERVNEYIVLGENDTEKKKIIVDTQSNIIVESTDNEAEIKKLLSSRWKSILDTIKVTKIYQKGGNFKSVDIVGELFKFANVN